MATTRLVTFNVSMSSDRLQLRMRAVADLVAALEPEVVALQEVTHRSLRILLEGEWFARSHFVPGPDEIDALPRYFTMLFSQRPFELAERHRFKRSRMGRELVVGRPEGRSLVVGTSHLESLPESSRERLRQLRWSLEHLAAYPQAVLMGDMNLIPEADGTIVPPEPWRDAWLEAGHAEEEGYTFDCERNPWAHEYRNRLDRVFCHLGPGWRVGGVRLIGTQELAGGIPPSDHFGLCCDLVEGQATA